MELKSMGKFIVALQKNGSNRTFMELKFFNGTTDYVDSNSSNRTFMELKST